jgi:RNA recognition motif-containing protein
MNIFVGNLSVQTTGSQLRNLFAAYGEVKSVQIITDKHTNRPRGTALIEMPDRVAGEKAIVKLNNTTIDMKSIVVNEARPQTLGGTR